jgi:hypothetical protein
MIDLSNGAKERIVALFERGDVREAERLIEASTDDPPLVADVARQGTDRIVFAMIRLSGGRIERLSESISLFRRDWRDLLVASDFADDVHAHRTWQPRRFEPVIAERWMAGELPPGVKFGLNASVAALLLAPAAEGQYR